MVGDFMTGLLIICMILRSRWAIKNNTNELLRLPHPAAVSGTIKEKADRHAHDFQLTRIQLLYSLPAIVQYEKV